MARRQAESLGEMAEQAHEEIQQHDERAGVRAQRDSLYDGIGHRPVRPPANDETVSRGSPWALAPWPTLEIAKAVADRLDRYLPGRGNRERLAAVGDDPQAQLRVVMQECVIPALREVRDQLTGEDYDVELRCEAMRVALRTRSFNGRDIEYAVEGGIYQAPVFSLVGTQAGHRGRLYAHVEIVSRGARRGARLHQCSRSAMRRDALHDLRNQMLY